MTWCDGYSEREKRHALARIFRDMETVVVSPCPVCGEPMEYEGATWEGDTGNAYGLSRVPAGWACGCGHWIPDEPEDPEPFDEFTGGWGAMRRGDA